VPWFIFCEICHRHHWSHYHSKVELLFAYEDPNLGEIEIMADTIDIASPVTTFYGALGELTDANGNVVDDTVATASWTSGDTTALTVVPNPNNAVDAVFTALGDAVVTVNVTGDTASGATVTGEGTVTITGFGTSSPAVSVAVNFTLTDPDAPATVPDAPVTPPAA
jgi:hypothetical protein